MSVENKPMTTKQKVLVGLIVVVAALFVGTVLLGSSGDTINKASCLDRGNVWDERFDRCYSSQANNFPQSYTVDCRQDKTVTLTLLSEGSARLIDRRSEPAVITLSKVSGGQWEYAAVSGQTRLNLSGETASIQTSEKTFQDCSLKSMQPVTPEGTHTVALGVQETARAGNVTITLQEVVQDSRCPADVVCIEGGGITVGVRLFSQGLIREVNISSDSAPYEFGGQAVSIPHIEPPRVSNTDISQDQYRITFLVSTSTPANG